MHIYDVIIELLSLFLLSSELLAKLADQNLESNATALFLFGTILIFSPTIRFDLVDDEVSLLGLDQAMRAHRHALRT